jgi:hypothetical protein
LTIQIGILLVQAVVDREVWRGRGFFARERPHAGRRLQWLACVYALSMVVRYVVLRSHLIPIVFHWVLAAYLFTLGRIMQRASSPGAVARARAGERPPRGPAA